MNQESERHTITEYEVWHEMRIEQTNGIMFHETIRERYDELKISSTIHVMKGNHERTEVP